MATQAERRERTRGSIVAAARELFTRDGYETTSVADVIDAAGVSRGALYHHFASKEDVFAAVFLATSIDAIRTASERIPAGLGPRDRLVRGCLEWLSVAAEPEISTILFVEGPRAIGWARCRTLEEATSLGVMRAAVASAVEGGELSVESVDTTARLLNALLAEAALRPGDDGAPAATITRMIEGLARPPSG